MTAQPMRRMPKPKRRSQLERSADTRALLIETTIACLSELGYARTTSKEIADRAGLSRGAQLHHFGTKTQLVVASMEHLYIMYNAEFDAKFAALPEDAEPAAECIEIVWSILKGPCGQAYLELALAARTDPDLREPMSALVEKMNASYDARLRSLFGATPGSEGVFGIAATAVLALLEGLAIKRVVREDDDEIERVVRKLKRLAPLAIQPKRD